MRQLTTESLTDEFARWWFDIDRQWKKIITIPGIEFPDLEFYYDAVQAGDANTADKFEAAMHQYFSRFVFCFLAETLRRIGFVVDSEDDVAVLSSFIAENFSFAALSSDKQNVLREKAIRNFKDIPSPVEWKNGVPVGSKRHGRKRNDFVKLFRRKFIVHYPVAQRSP